MRCTIRKVLKLVSVVSFMLATNFLVAILVRSDTLPSPRLSGKFEKFVDSDQDFDKVGQLGNGAVESDTNFREEPQNLHAHRKISSVLVRTERGVSLSKEIEISENNKNVPALNPASISKSAEVRQAKRLAANQETELNDIFISVKTTGKYHESRLNILLETWVELARPVTTFFTDAEDEVYKKKTGGHMINTNCSATHDWRALCCKLSVEYDTYIESGKRWFCHVDDDTYINIPALIHLLQSYNHTEDWYLGKPSLHHPVEIIDPKDKKGTQKIAFRFATGGAGFCLSRGLALKMMPYTGGGKFQTVCHKIRLPDDVTIGFIIYSELKKTLTVIPNFHSHLEGLWQIKPSQLENQITLSYKVLPQEKTLRSKFNLNVVELSGVGYKEEEDPTRFKSIHCHLFSYLPKCSGKNRQR